MNTYTPRRFQPRPPVMPGIQPMPPTGNLGNNFNQPFPPPPGPPGAPVGQPGPLPSLNTPPGQPQQLAGDLMWDGTKWVRRNQTQYDRQVFNANQNGLQMPGSVTPGGPPARWM